MRYSKPWVLGSSRSLINGFRLPPSLVDGLPHEFEHEGAAAGSEVEGR